MSRRTKSKRFIAKHQTHILIGAVVVTTGAAILMRSGIKQHDDFLKAKGLYEEFYTPED